MIKVFQGVSGIYNVALMRPDNDLSTKQYYLWHLGGTIFSNEVRLAIEEGYIKSDRLTAKINLGVMKEVTDPFILCLLIDVANESYDQRIPISHIAELIEAELLLELARCNSL